ncbi:hypothetical protein LTR09_001346 [Extremus antarcticus]|uniref:Uncharacterized protein n=1 Tax=Extremus antarcticus TaxID=702011 RepID=A0AAJ0LWX2_9PEZI|nr:hypothetical protein LTR09_001346 [Extremus antarcticus]
MARKGPAMRAVPMPAPHRESRSRTSSIDEVPPRAGKRPTLRPVSSTPPASPSLSKHKEAPKPAAKPAAKRRKITSAPPASRHGMVTRTRGKIFPLMKLPPELRNNIYRHAFLDSNPTSIDLSKVKLPPLLSISRTFTTIVRCNWCIRSRHWHGPLYIRYEKAGKIDLHPLLRGPNSLSKKAIRFRRLEFRVICVCCDPGITIGVVDLEVVGRTQTVTLTMKNTKQAEATTALEKMVSMIEEEVEEAGERRPFNGFTVQDVVNVGKCFKVEDAELSSP